MIGTGGVNYDAGLPPPVSDGGADAAARADSSVDGAVFDEASTSDRPESDTGPSDAGTTDGSSDDGGPLD
jgi:hypothetical protein